MLIFNIFLIYHKVDLTTTAKSDICPKFAYKKYKIKKSCNLLKKM